MRRYVWGAVLALTVLSVITVGAANAQGGGGGRRGGMFGMMGGGRGGGLGMLRIPDVQKELKMTPDQIAKVDTKQQEMRSAFQAGGGGQGGDAEERQKRMAEIQAMQTKAVADILNADQQKRFHQLELQQQGTMALARKDVQDELKLTDDQKTKIDDIRQKAMDDMRSSMQGVDFQSMTAEERQQMMTKMREAQKSTSDKVEAVLTDDQKKQWKEMQGTPFKFPPMQPGRGGPGGGGGRRGNPAT